MIHPDDSDSECDPNEGNVPLRSTDAVVLTSPEICQTPAQCQESGLSQLCRVCSEERTEEDEPLPDNSRQTLLVLSTDHQSYVPSPGINLVVSDGRGGIVQVPQALSLAEYLEFQEWKLTRMRERRYTQEDNDQHRSDAEAQCDGLLCVHPENHVPSVLLEGAGHKRIREFE